MARFCALCGAQMPDISGFCPACGKPVATGAAAAAPAPKTVFARLPDRISGPLAYLVLPAVVFWFVEPYRRNPFLRFHCAQALLYAGACVLAAALIICIGMVPGLALLGIPLLMLWFFAATIFGAALMIKAFQGERYCLPVAGQLAEKLARR